MIDTDKISFILGKESSDYLQILIDNYAYPDSNDFWDGNWLNTRIIIKAGAFSGNYKAQLRNVDFLDFKNGLKNLYIKLDGYASFSCIEDYLQIKIKGDGLGHFSADCIAIDNPGIYGHKLEFNIDFDQTEISAMTKILDLIITVFPIKQIEQLKQFKNKS
jgi:hypothetical protein